MGQKRVSKDIKIITFHRAVNFGAVLQTYALYQCLKRMVSPNIHVTVFDYKCRHIDKFYRLIVFRKSFRYMIKQLLYLPVKALQKCKVRNFVYRHIQFSSQINDNDVFITGSDQVWNNTCTGFDKAYFLDFIKNRRSKNAYAASFGYEQIPEKNIEQYRSLLKDYNIISVRELQGAQIIRNLLDIDVPVALDPTLLINKDEWCALMNVKPVNKEYILLYLLIPTATVMRFAEELSKETGYIIVYICEKYKKVLANTMHKRFVDPKEWVSLFANSSYIITNSFHGTAFSINFNKPFFTELLPPPSQVNSRLENILKQFGLTDRLIVNGVNKSIEQRIDYDHVNMLLENERQKSIDLLKCIIGEDK